MSKLKFVSADRLFSSLYRDLGESVASVSEVDIIEWVGSALELMGAITQYEQTVAFIEVKNHQIELPCGLHTLNQIAKNDCWASKADECGIASTVVNALEEEGPHVGVPVNCNGTPISEYELAYYRPYYDLQYEYGNWVRSGIYNSCFTPVRQTCNTFFNIFETEEDKIYNTAYGRNEYKIVNNDYVRFSFKEGQVAISYNKQKLDERGYPMVPEHASYQEALVAYVAMKLAKKDFYNGREGAAQRLNKMESDWHWYCRQAKTYALMPNGIDDHQDLLEQSYSILPQINRYYGYFGKLNTRGNLNYRDPNRRNVNNFFRGYTI